MKCFLCNATNAFLVEVTAPPNPPRNKWTHRRYCLPCFCKLLGLRKDTVDEPTYQPPECTCSICTKLRIEEQQRWLEEARKEKWLKANKHLIR